MSARNAAKRPSAIALRIAAIIAKDINAKPEQAAAAIESRRLPR